MVLIAHITDLHLVEESYQQRGLAERCRLAYLNTGRSIHPASRREHLLQALRAARVSDHIVLTGDLTEDGVPEQFEVLAEVLWDAGVDPERVTLVAGNHDLYGDPGEWRRALEGPLRPFARSSRAGVPLDFGEALILPIATAIPQPLLRSAGAFSPAQALELAELASDCYVRERTLIVAQHHAPLGNGNAIWNWIDGIDNAREFLRLLRLHEHMHIMHGHTHLRISTAVDEGRGQQIHAGGAVFESALNLRFYEAFDGGVRVIEGAPPRMPRALAGAAAFQSGFALLGVEPRQYTPVESIA